MNKKGIYVASFRFIATLFDFLERFLIISFDGKSSIQLILHFSDQDDVSFHITEFSDFLRVMNKYSPCSMSAVSDYEFQGKKYGESCYVVVSKVPDSMDHNVYGELLYDIFIDYDKD